MFPKELAGFDTSMLCYLAPLSCTYSCCASPDEGDLLPLGPPCQPINTSTEVASPVSCDLQLTSRLFYIRP